MAKKIARLPAKSKTALKKIITVKNADGDPDTTATIVIQNKIKYTPKISIIVPVFNVENYIRECLDSVLSQTLHAIEVICIDDGSSDKSLEIMKEYATKDNRITIITQNNSGSGIARNCGLNVAKGEFIAFMDPDDFYPSENTLKNVYSAAVANDVKICGGSFVVLENGVIDTNIIRFGKGYIFEKNQKIKYSDYQFDCGYWRFIFNREFLTKNNLYFPDYLRGQDVPFFIHAMALSGEFYALQEPTYVYRTSYKKINFTERRFMDYTKSLLHCLKLAVKFELHNLQDTIINVRIDNQFYTNLCAQFSNIPDCKELSDALIEFRDNIRDSQNISTSNKKKIFLISHPGVLTSVGGATKIFFDMGKTLTEADYEVTLLCWSDLDKKVNEFYADYNVHFLNLHRFYHNLNFEQAINRYIKSKKPDLMIFFFPDVFLKASLSEENNNIPKILMFHSRPDWYFHNWTNTQIEQIISLYKNTYTQVLLPSYVNLLPDFIDKSTVRAIANPVQQDIRRNNYDEHKKIIFLTRHDQCKGLEFLLMSYKIIANKHPSWKLDIYGQFFSPEYEKTIRDMISDLKLTKNVFLKGVTKDVLSTLCNYDFCVFPSYFEGFSVGLAEALSVGLPCIGLKGASGVNEQIIDGVNGFLCDNKYSDFAKKIETLIKDKNLRKTFSKNAIDSIEQYAKDKIYDNWLKYINEILSGKPSKNHTVLKATKNNNTNTLFPISSIRKAYIYNSNAVLDYKNTKKIPSGPQEIIVSLTSYPARIGTVNQTIETLLNQSLCPDKVILWLAPEQFPNREADLPQQLLDLRYKGLVIDWYHDIRSYKKLIPTLKKYPDALIVTADDDILYKPDWLRKLYNAYQNNHEIIWCHRSHKIQNDLYNYMSWRHCISTNTPAITNFCTTGGGVLYPPHCFHQDVLNEQFFMSLCPDADDIWFWSMLVLNGKKVCTVPNNYTTISLIDGTQEDALWASNGQGGNNNKCLARMYNKYPALLRVIKTDTNKQNTHKNKNIKIKPYLLFPYYLCACLYERYIKLPLTSLKKHGIAGLHILNGKKIKELPTVQANAFISLGWNCKPAYQLKQNKLRQNSLPFDWMYNYTLDFILETLQNKQLNWFYDFTEEQTISKTKRRLKDNHSQMISLHHFPKNYSIIEYLPIFNSIFTRRKNRFNKMLSEYDDICFVMNRTDDVLDILKFIKNISSMYPKTHFTIVNIRQDDNNKDIYKYKLNKKCILYDIHFNDVHDTDANTKTNPNAWIGSNSFWKKLTKNFSITPNTNRINIDNDFDIYMKEVSTYIDKMQKQQNVLSQQIADFQSNASQSNDALAQKIIDLNTVTENKSNDLSQQIADFQSSTSQSNDALAQKIIDLNTVTKNKSNDLSQQIADFQSSASQGNDALAQKIIDLNTVTENKSNDLSQQIADFQSSTSQGNDALAQKIIDLNTVTENKSNDLSQQIADFQSSASQSNDALVQKIIDLINTTKDIPDTIAQHVSEQIKAIQHNVETLNQQNKDTQSNIINTVDQIKKHADELTVMNSEPYWAHVYHDTTANTTWLKNKSVSPGRWAISYIVLYVLYRILDEAKPKSILECGLGQSSKLTIQYADSHNADLTICENNPEWLSFFQRQFPTADKYTTILDTEMVNIVPEHESRTYANFKPTIGNKKFNLVLIDGPLGSPHYSRPEILDIVDNLDKSFVILLDDMNRIGEQEIWQLLKQKLHSKGIEFKERKYSSDKTVGLICSMDLAYLTSL